MCRLTDSCLSPLGASGVSRKYGCEAHSGMLKVKTFLHSLSNYYHNISQKLFVIGISKKAVAFFQR